MIRKQTLLLISASTFFFLTVCNTLSLNKPTAAASIPVRTGPCSLLGIVGDVSVAPNPSIQPPEAKISLATAGTVGLIDRWGTGKPLNVHWSPNCKYFAVNAFTQILIYDAVSLTVIHIINLDGLANVVEFTSDDTLQFVESAHTLQEWSAASNSVTTVLDDAVMFKQVGAIDSDHGIVASVNNDNWSVELRDLKSGELLKTLEGHEDLVWDLDFSSDGTMLVSGGYDGIVNVWNVATGELLQRLVGTKNVGSVLFGPDDKTILASDLNFSGARVWTVGKDEPNYWVDHVGGAIAVSPDGHYFAVPNESYGLELHDVVTGDLIRTYIGHTARISSIAFSPDGQVLVTTGDDKTVRFWSIQVDQQQAALVGFSDALMNLAFSPDQTALASLNWLDGHVTIHSLSDGKLQQEMAASPGVQSNEVVFSPDGTLLAVGNNDGNVLVWEVATAKLKYTLGGHQWLVRSIAFSPDGRTLAAAGKGVFLWDMTDGSRKNVCEGHVGYVNSVAFSPDGLSLISGSDDSTVRLWTARDCQLQQTFFLTPPRRVFDVAFDPTGKYLAAGDDNRMVYLWDLASGQAKFQIEAHVGQTEALAFNHDGSILASSGDYDDPVIRLWNTSDGKPLTTLTGHGWWVSGLEFSADDRLLVSSSGDGTVRFWGIQP